MELELKNACLDTYETSGEVTLTQEETMETIVPDYCPDIARIISTEGRVYLHSRELRKGKAELTGTARVTVLYIPEGEGDFQTLSFAIPFTMEAENRAFQGCQLLTAEVELEHLESRMLNPRKIFTHCRFVGRAAGYQKTALAFSTDVEAEERLGIEKRQERQKAVLLTEISEKDFTFTEEMSLSPGRSGAAELLNHRICGTVTESKIVGNKLIFKGLFTVALLYRNADGLCCSTTGELPFSQILEIENCSENAAATLQLQLTGSDLQVSGDDSEGRQIAVTIYAHATAMMCCEQELMLLHDLYSTAYETQFEAAPLSLTVFHEKLTRRQLMREVLEIGVVADSILSLSVSCGAVSVSREGAGVTLRTAATIRALYRDEGGTPLVAERTTDVSCQTELPEDCLVFARAVCTEEVQGSLGDRGIEVRFPVDFYLEACRRVKRACITAARLNEDAPQNRGGEPSLVLRCLGGRETLWELAKRHHTTISAILLANQLEHESEIPKDRLLLIPKKRA